MLRRTLDYLRVGWEMLGHLHLAHWILLILISLFPASATSAFLALAGEHSTFFLCVVFLLCFSLMSLMILALLGHPVQASSRDRRVIANTPISTELPATVDLDQLPRPLRLRILAPADGSEVHLNRTVRGSTSNPSAQLQVLVFSGDGRWYPQQRTTIDGNAWWTDCRFGNDELGRGEQFRIVAISTEPPVGSPTTSLPANSVLSQVVNVVRSRL